jgi:RNA polymerase sigma-70 factor (ECF subfamily)
VWSVSDDALLAGLATGDPDAAQAFVERFRRRVYGLALTILRESRAAEDVAQEAFVRAWRHADGFDSRRGTVVAWLLTITRNLAIDARRAQRADAVDPGTLVDLVGLERGPAEQAVIASDLAELTTALRALPRDQQRALLLAGLLGQTAREVAEIEQIPLGTAKTRIRTATLRLRAALIDRQAFE